MCNRQFKAQVSRREPNRQRPQALGSPILLQAETPKEPSRLDHLDDMLGLAWVGLWMLLGLSLWGVVALIVWWLVG